MFLPARGGNNIEGTKRGWVDFQKVRKSLPFFPLLSGLRGDLYVGGHMFQMGWALRSVSRCSWSQLDSEERRCRTTKLETKTCA